MHAVWQTKTTYRHVCTCLLKPSNSLSLSNCCFLSFSLNRLMAPWQQHFQQTPVDIADFAHTQKKPPFFMLKEGHWRGDGSPAQCVPVHFHHVIPAEHGVAFSPALWETSLSFLSLFVHVCVRAQACVCQCVTLPSYVVPSFQQHKLPVLGPPAWIGHGDSVWPARMNAARHLPECHKHTS